MSTNQRLSCDRSCGTNHRRSLFIKIRTRAGCKEGRKCSGYKHDVICGVTSPRAPCSRRGAGAAWQLACACPRHDRHLQQHRDGSPARNGPASRTPGPTCMVEQQHPDFQVSRRLPPHPAQLAERSPIADLRRRRALRAAWAWRSFVVQRGLRQHSSANGSARETGLRMEQVAAGDARHATRAMESLRNPRPPTRSR